jgi:hypothetical protein
VFRTVLAAGKGDPHSSGENKFYAHADTPLQNERTERKEGITTPGIIEQLT